MEFILGFASASVLSAMLAYCVKLLLETRIREAVKAEYAVKLADYQRKIKSEDRVEEARWKTTHDACLDALGVIDAYISGALTDSKGSAPTKQPIKIRVARECHNKLILASSNLKLVEMFNEILFLNDTGQEFKHPPTDLLNEFRNEIRSELGFGGKLVLNRDVAWISRMNMDEESMSGLSDREIQHS